MHLYDIEDALAERDGAALRHAFRLLVSFPRFGKVGSVRSAARLDELLDLVAAALQLDQTIMPEELRLTMDAVTKVSLEDTASFAQGAVIVFEFRDHWRALHVDVLSAA